MLKFHAAALKSLFVPDHFEENISQILCIIIQRLTQCLFVSMITFMLIFDAKHRLLAIHPVSYRFVPKLGFGGGGVEPIPVIPGDGRVHPG